MEPFKQPLVGVTLAITACVAVGLSVCEPPPQVGFVAALGAASTIAWIWRAGATNRWTTVALGICLGAVALAAGALEEAPTAELQESMGGERIRGVIEARVVGVGPRSEKGDTLEVAVERRDGTPFESGEPRVNLFVPHRGEAAPDGEPIALPGDRIEGFVRFEPYPQRALPGQPSPAELMGSRGVAARAAALEPIEVRSQKPDVAEAIAGHLVTVRLGFERHILDALETEEAGLAIALTTANRGYLEPEVSEPFRRTGTGHLLAISGLHMGVLAALMWWVFGRIVDRSRFLLRRFGRRRACGFAVVVALGAYVAVIGAPVSAVRAWVAVSLGIGALLLLRPICPFHALAAAALGLIVWNPMVVSSLGFQLSFAATLGILLFVYFEPAVLAPPEDVFGESEPRRRRWLRRLGLFVGVSTSATLATWPVVAANLGEVQVAGIWTNLVATPLVSAVLFPALVVAVIVSLVWREGGVVLLEVTVDGLLWLRDGLSLVADAPGSVVVTGALPAWALAAMSAGVLVWVTSRWRPARLGLAAMLILAGTSPAFGPTEAVEAGQMRVHFIPVGQGDATLVEFPDGSTMLVDGGGSKFGRDPGRYVVAPYLKRLGIDRIDWVVVSHADTDHIDGLFAVVEHLDSGVLVFDPADEAPAIDKLSERVQEKGGALAPVERSIEAVGRESAFDVVRPDLDTDNANDASLVVRLRRRSAAVLLPGDIERRAERWLLERHDVRSAVLKAPHHGSATSSSEAFVEAVEPSVAVVSAGRFNHFGHPAQRVLDRYSRHGVRTFETAHRGLVRVDIERDGRLTVRALHPGE